MNIDKLQLGDFSKDACAFRLMVAIKYCGLSNTDVALASNVGKSTITNALKGDQYPSRSVEDYFYRNFGIDYNYFRAGELKAMPHSTVEKLVQIASSLQVVNNNSSN